MELAAPEPWFGPLMGMVAKVVPVGTRPEYDLIAAP
jgi:hypothetical protein